MHNNCEEGPQGGSDSEPCCAPSLTHDGVVKVKSQQDRRHPHTALAAQAAHLETPNALCPFVSLSDDCCSTLVSVPVQVSQSSDAIG